MFTFIAQRSKWYAWIWEWQCVLSPEWAMGTWFRWVDLKWQGHVNVNFMNLFIHCFDFYIAEYVCVNASLHLKFHPLHPIITRHILPTGIKMPPSWDEILTCLLSDIGESFNVLCFPFLVLVVPLAPSLALATAMFKWSCCNTQTYLLLAIKMKLHASTCGLSEWQILSKKWQVPSTTINWTNSFKWKYTLLHAGMYGLSEWHLPL